jgi:hypothetical protein
MGQGATDPVQTNPKTKINMKKKGVRNPHQLFLMNFHIYLFSPSPLLSLLSPFPGE